MEQTQMNQRVQVKDSVCIEIKVAILAIYVENQIVLFKKEFLLIFESLFIIRINMMFINYLCCLWKYIIYVIIYLVFPCACYRLFHNILIFHSLFHEQKDYQ